MNNTDGELHSNNTEVVHASSSRAWSHLLSRQSYAEGGCHSHVTDAETQAQELARSVTCPGHGLCLVRYSLSPPGNSP